MLQSVSASGPNGAHSFTVSKQRETNVQPSLFLGKSVVVIRLKHAEGQRPGRKVKGVEEAGVFLLSRQLAKGIRGQECHRDAVQTHQICKTNSVDFPDASLRLEELANVEARPGRCLPATLTAFRSQGSAAAAVEEQARRPHTAWNSACTFAKDTSWAVWRREDKMP